MKIVIDFIVHDDSVEVRYNAHLIIIPHELIAVWFNEDDSLFHYETANYELDYFAKLASWQITRKDSIHRYYVPTFIFQNACVAWMNEKERV